MLKKTIIFRGILINFKRLVEIYCHENNDAQIDATNITASHIIKSIIIPKIIGYTYISEKIMFFKIDTHSILNYCDYVIGYNLDTIEFVSHNNKTNKWSINNNATIIDTTTKPDLDNQLILLSKYYNVDDNLIKNWIQPTEYI